MHVSMCVYVYVHGCMCVYACNMCVIVCVDACMCVCVCINAVCVCVYMLYTIKALVKTADAKKTNKVQHNP